MHHIIALFFCAIISANVFDKDLFMKIICNFISIILICGFVAITFVMQNNTLQPNIETFPHLNAVIYSILVAFLGFLAGFMFNQGKVEELKSDTAKQLKKAEKSNIDTKESLDKIDRLNAKIETLEIALQEALKNNKG